MRRIGLVLEYVGTGYQGFQVQARETCGATDEACGAPEGGTAHTGQLTGTGRAVRTVQGAVEAAIARITGEQRRITGAGRTDAGVHALGQVASFDTGSRIPGDRFAPVPRATADVSAQVVSGAGRLHARYDAIARCTHIIVPSQIVGDAEPGLERQLGPGAQLGSAVLAERRYWFGAIWMCRPCRRHPGAWLGSTIFVHLRPRARLPKPASERFAAWRFGLCRARSWDWMPWRWRSKRMGSSTRWSAP